MPRSQTFLEPGAVNGGGGSVEVPRIVFRVVSSFLGLARSFDLEPIVGEPVPITGSKAEAEVEAFFDWEPVVETDERGGVVVASVVSVFYWFGRQ